MKKKLLIVIPSYNEEVALPQLLQQLKNTSFLSSFNVDELVVNDCSRDRTAVVAREYGARVLDLTNNLGIGGAVQAGIKYARANNYDYALQMDGDGQHPPSEVNKLLEVALQSQADVIIGSRFLSKEGFQTSYVRRTGIKYFHWLNKLLTHRNIYDTTSGFRLLGRKAIDLAAIYYPDDYPEPESLIFFSRAGLHIKEVPVVMRERQGGSSSIRGFSSVFYMVKVTLSSILSYVRKI